MAWTACWLGVTDARAQRVVLTADGGSIPASAILVHDLATGLAESIRAGMLRRPAVFTADGRFAFLTRAVFGSAGDVSELYDTSSRRAVPLAFQAVVAHPRELAVFGAQSGAVQRLDASGLRTLPACGGFNEFVEDLDVTVDGSLLMAVCSSRFTTPASHYVVVMEAASGRVVRATTRAAGPAFSIAASARGDTALVLVRQSTEAVGLWHVDTVADRRQNVFVDAPFPTPAAAGGCDRIGVTAAHDRAAYHCEWMLGGARVARTELVDLDTSQRRVLASIPEAFSLRFTPDGAHALVATDQPPAVQFLDVARDTLEWQVPVPVVNLSAAFAPLPPAGLTATVAARNVHLAWSLPAPSPVATGYVLDVGLAPGQTLASVPLGAATAVTVPGVPPGDYFVRLRATNCSGTGDASAEVVVRVP